MNEISIALASFTSLFTVSYSSADIQRSSEAAKQLWELRSNFVLYQHAHFARLFPNF
ncbi:MAG: hypothetical protein JWQ40_3157 [Segetibacter sp.]|nr:hypothetical protein [Segetibacter sp.]